MTFQICYVVSMKFKVVHPESECEWIEEYDTEEEFLDNWERINSDGHCNWKKLVDGKWM